MITGEAPLNAWFTLPPLANGGKKYSETQLITAAGLDLGSGKSISSHLVEKRYENVIQECEIPTGCLDT
jgi:hypothetical protein